MFGIAGSSCIKLVEDGGVSLFYYIVICESWSNIVGRRLKEPTNPTSTQSDIIEYNTDDSDGENDSIHKDEEDKDYIPDKDVDNENEEAEEKSDQEGDEVDEEGDEEEEDKDSGFVDIIPDQGDDTDNEMDMIMDMDQMDYHEEGTDGAHFGWKSIV